jgi:hypothetical protein
MTQKKDKREMKGLKIANKELTMFSQYKRHHHTGRMIYENRQVRITDIAAELNSSMSILKPRHLEIVHPPFGISV